MLKKRELEFQCTPVDKTKNKNLTVQEKYLNDVLIKIERNLHFSAEEKKSEIE